jgi:ABC-2 type transport system permease protein
MTDQLLAELRKMRSTRTNLGLLGGMVALILLTVLLNGFIPKPHELASHDNQHALLSAGTSAALFAALIGVMAITSEFRHGTIRPTFVVTPHRTRVIAAKVAASLLMGVLFGLAAIGLSFGVGCAILSVRDIPLELGTSHVLWLMLGTPAMTAAWAAIGVGLGAVVRNQVFAVIGLIVWAMVVDNLLRGLIPGATRPSAPAPRSSPTRPITSSQRPQAGCSCSATSPPSSSPGRCSSRGGTSRDDPCSTSSTDASVSARCSRWTMPPRFGSSAPISSSLPTHAVYSNSVRTADAHDAVRRVANPEQAFRLQLMPKADTEFAERLLVSRTASGYETTIGPKLSTLGRA